LIFWQKTTNKNSIGSRFGKTGYAAGWLGGWVAPNDRGPGFALERQMMIVILSDVSGF
jgi:hypothetical protein